MLVGKKRFDSEVIIENLDDKKGIRNLLDNDKLANGYILGNLAPEFFKFCDCWGARNENRELTSLLLIYDGLSLPIVAMAGNGQFPSRFLKMCKPMLPDRFKFQARDEHMGAISNTIGFENLRQQYRMGLRRRDYQPQNSLESSTEVQQLDHRDTADIVDLYNHYPNNFFQPSQLETGYYFGIRSNDGSDLLSIAGVHIVNEEDDIAIVGNMLTHPSVRGRGLATKCCERLLNELFETFSLVGLNVQVGNKPAIRMYKNFGFEINNIFWTGRYGDPQAN